MPSELWDNSHTRPQTPLPPALLRARRRLVGRGEFSLAAAATARGNFQRFPLYVGTSYHRLEPRLGTACGGRGHDGPAPSCGTAGDPDPHSPRVDSRAEFRVSGAERGPSVLHHAERDEYAGHAAAKPTVTRIRPPEDVIKLEDRLNYLLQPPLEALLADRALAMPLEPFPFQYEGVAFLYPRHAAILADEMGLGKSMQAITAIRLLLCRGEIRSVLLVCPKPLVTNWQREFHLWAPEVPALAIEGDQARRAWQWRLADVPVRIANYEVVIRDREVLEGGEDGRPVPFDLVVLDESQRIKNRGSTTSEVVRSLSRRRSWALTGTPVENSAEDLVGIFEFLAPGFLSPELKPRKMGRTVSDHVLRRTKEQVLAEMPPKMFRDAELELSPEQRETYRLAEEEGIVRLTEMGEGATIQHVFELVLRLKQICNFDTATGASSKLERLEADLEEVAGSGRKAIVFSQWVGTIRRLAKALRRFGPLEYHGQVPSSRRDAVICRFRDDPAAPRDPDELWCRGGGPEPAVRQLCFPLRPLVEPGRRGPGDQPGPSHRRRRPDDRHALPRLGHDRRADRSHLAGEARVVRDDLLRH